MKNLKNQLRSDALVKRNSLDFFQRNFLSKKITSYLDIFSWKKKVISVFWPISSEVDSRFLIKNLRFYQNDILLPSIENKKMIFRLFENENELIKNSLGFKHPKENSLKMDPEIVLLPLVAFDKLGNRLGYGSGYYDRTLSEMKDRRISPYLVGIAFSIQEVKCIPYENHDFPLHSVLSERGFKSFL